MQGTEGTKHWRYPSKSCRTDSAFISKSCNSIRIAQVSCPLRERCPPTRQVMSTVRLSRYGFGTCVLGLLEKNHARIFQSNHSPIVPQTIRPIMRICRVPVPFRPNALAARCEDLARESLKESKLPPYKKVSRRARERDASRRFRRV